MNNQDIRLLNVSGQRSGTVSTRQRHHLRLSPPLSPPPVVDIVDTDVEDRAVTDASFVDHLVLPYIMSSPPSNDPVNHHNLTANKGGLVNVGENKKPDEEQSPKTGHPPWTSPQPLSPHVISCDPQNQSPSEIVRTTEDSEIYAEISIPCLSAGKGFSDISFPLDHQLSIRDRAVTVPYLPDLKEHFIALRSKQGQVNKEVESRGTFSPNPRARTVTFTVSEVKQSVVSDPAVTQHAAISSVPQHVLASPDVPQHVITSPDVPQHVITSPDVPQHDVVSSDVPQHDLVSSDVPQHIVSFNVPQHELVSSGVSQHLTVSSDVPEHALVNSDVEVCSDGPQLAKVRLSENDSRTTKPVPPPVPLRSQYI